MQDRNKTKQQLIEELISLRAHLELKKGVDGNTIRSEANPIISTELYAMIFDRLPLGTFVIRKDGALIYVNPAFVQLTGYTLTDIDREKEWFQKAYPDKEYRSKVLYAWVKYQTQQLITEKIFQVVCKDGKSKTIEFNMISVADGTVISMLTDVTGCGAAEELLKEKEEQWRLLLDTMNEGFITVNESGIPVFVNQRFCELTGYTQEELVGRPVSAFLDAENLRIFQSEFSQRSNGFLNPYEIVLRRKDGSPMIFLMSPRPLYDSSGRFVGSFGTCMDITERKKMEEAVRRSERRFYELADEYLNIVENATEGIYRSIPEGRYIMANRAFASMLGYGSPEELLASVTDISNQVYVDSEARMDSIRKVRQNNIGEFEVQARRKDGELIWLLNSVRVVRNDQGEILYFEGITKNISERKGAEEALEESRKRYRELIESIDESVWEIDVTGRFSYISPSIEKLVGYGQREVLGKLPYEFVGVEDMEKLKKLLHDSLDNHVSFTALEGVVVHKHGAHIAVEVSGNPFYVEKGRFGGYRGILRDISEIKKLQEEIIKSQKLESIGMLAGGIAQDFNTLLMGILGYIGLAKLNIRQEVVVERSLSKAEESCLRAKELARRLLTFSRDGDPLRKPIDIRDAVRESAKSVLGGSNIQCRYYLAKHLHAVKVDEAQIRQAIGNIIVNAMEASPAGGTIAVKGENVLYRNMEGKGQEGRPFIRVTISDRGKGIPRESLKSIFDPYFTTKDMGDLKGAGLGLSISYSIIKKHGGDITLQSAVGKGTSVSIYLPAYGDSAQAEIIGGSGSPVSDHHDASV